MSGGNPTALGIDFGTTNSAVSLQATLGAGDGDLFGGVASGLAYVGNRR